MVGVVVPWAPYPHRVCHLNKGRNAVSSLERIPSGLCQNPVPLDDPVHTSWQLPRQRNPNPTLPRTIRLRHPPTPQVHLQGRVQKLWRTQARIAPTSHFDECIEIRLRPADVLVVCELVCDGAEA
jgi:hypothetical protein